MDLNSLLRLGVNVVKCNYDVITAVPDGQRNVFAFESFILERQASKADRRWSWRKFSVRREVAKDQDRFLRDKFQLKRRTDFSICELLTEFFDPMVDFRCLNRDGERLAGRQKLGDSR